MNETGISWTDRTWNPMSGCKPVGSECAHCYAKNLAERLRGTAAFPNGFDLTLRPHRLMELYAISKPSRIFVNSMSDLFWEAVPEPYVNQVVDAIEDNPHVQCQVLTKRPERMLAYSKRRPLPPNFWAGVSIGMQKYAYRADILREITASVRFISAEPLLTSLDLNLTGIHWLIVGGESGKHLNEPQEAEKRGLVMQEGGKWIPRPDRIPWVTALQDACVASGTAFFFKQWGGPKSFSGGSEL